MSDVSNGPIVNNKKIPLLRRPKVLMVAGVISFILFIVGILYYFHAMKYESTDDAFIDGHIIQVSPKVAGQVVKVFITDNQEVKQGQVLIEIDPRDYQARLAQAKATMDSAIQKHKSSRINVELTHVTSDADVQLATAGVELAKAQLAQTEAQIPADEQEVTRTENDLKRYQEVYPSGVVTPQQMDSARSAARTAQSNLQAAKKRVSVAQAEVGQAIARLDSAKTAPQKVAFSESQVNTSEADIAQAKAALEQAELNLSYTKITASEAGRITRKSVEEGAYVQVGQPLFALVPRNVWVTANFKETQITHIKPGQPAWIDVDAYPDKTFTGHVDSIQDGSGARFSLLPPENATGNYVKVVQRVPVKIVFDEQPDVQHVLGPGMSVVPEIQVK